MVECEWKEIIVGDESTYPMKNIEVLFFHKDNEEILFGRMNRYHEVSDGCECRMYDVEIGEFSHWRDNVMTPEKEKELIKETNEIIELIRKGAK